MTKGMKFMNILVLGNGFDLEHKLPTSYHNFLEFCQKARKIYTIIDEGSLENYTQTNLDDWEMDTYVKELLSDAFGKRTSIKIPHEDGTYGLDVSTPNKALDELYCHIGHNTWLEYFLNCPSYIGENWIDFESEISRVIQALDAARFQVECGGSVEGIEKSESQVVIAIWKASKWSLQSTFKSVREIDEFTVFLNIELERLIRALEIYVAEFVRGISVTKKSLDIEEIKPDHILSFNYSDTYERVYGRGKNINYDYIHGKAHIDNTLETNNMVLGIDEYLPKKRMNKETEFIAFKKFYQRIHKETGCKYKEWVDDIKEEYNEYLWKKNNVCSENVDTPFQKYLPVGKCREKCLFHQLYIFGHSLDITDKDILRDLILNDNVLTTIYYVNKKVYGQQIANLVKVIGQNELIRRTGGSTKTIVFRQQTK